MTFWHLDPETLREVVDDRAALGEALATASPSDRIWMLRIVGRLDEAELIGRTLLDEAGDRWRPLLLLADVLRWQGRFGETEKLQAEARELATNASRRATTAQHIGKRLFDQGLLVEAENEFATALELRRQIRAVPDLIESSRIAWERARR